MMFLALGLKCGPSGVEAAPGLSVAAKRFSFSKEASASAPMPQPHCWRNLRRVRYFKFSRSGAVVGGGVSIFVRRNAKSPPPWGGGEGRGGGNSTDELCALGRSA